MVPQRPILSLAVLGEAPGGLRARLGGALGVAQARLGWAPGGLRSRLGGAFVPELC